MRLGLSLGRDVRMSSGSCLRLGTQLARVEDALVFAEFYLTSEMKPLTPRELNHVSTGVHSSALAALSLEGLLSGEDKERASSYRRVAESANSYIRRKLKEREKTPFTKKDLMEIGSRVKKLKGKLNDLSEKTKLLCVPAAKPRVSRAPVPSGSAAPKPALSGRHRFVYPRYRIANLGRK